MNDVAPNIVELRLVSTNEALLRVLPMFIKECQTSGSRCAPGFCRRWC